MVFEQTRGGTAVKLSQAWGFFGARRKAPCVRTVELFRGADIDGLPVWRAVADGDVQCIDGVASLVLGKAPAGFSTTIRFEPANHGKHTLVVFGIGIGIEKLALPKPG